MSLAPYAPVLIKLLKGPLYADDAESWDLALRHRRAVDEYMSQLGLELVLAESDGLAFLRRRRPAPAGVTEAGEEEAAAAADGEAEAPDDGLPELVARRELPYTASLLCVLLLEELYRFEASGEGEARLVLHRARIRDLALPYLPKKSNEAKQADALDAQINRLAQYGFLRPIKAGSDEFQVTPLLKHKITPRVLGQAAAQLKERAGGDDE